MFHLALSAHLILAHVTACGSVFRVNYHCLSTIFTVRILVPKNDFFLSAMSGRERFNFCEAREFFTVLPCVCFWHSFLFAGRLQLFAAHRNEDGNVLKVCRYKKYDKKKRRLYLFYSLKFINLKLVNITMSVTPTSAAMAKTKLL